MKKSETGKTPDKDKNRENATKNERTAVIQQYERYRTGSISREDWIMYLVDKMDNYIKHRIGLKHREMGAEFEDLMQQGRLAIIEKVDSYDPYMSLPTSYFTDFIDQFTKAACDNKGMTKYYVGILTKLDAVAKKYGYIDCMDQNLTPDMLSILSDVSLMTVLETLKYKSQTVISIDSSYDVLETDEAFQVMKTPEKAVIDSEVNRFLQKQLSGCTELEKYLLENIILSSEPKSYRSLVKELKTPEMQLRFKDELPRKVEQVFLEQKVNHALRRIRCNPSASKYIPVKNRDNVLHTWNTVEEQATSEDIENAIMNNLLDLD